MIQALRRRVIIEPILDKKSGLIDLPETSQESHSGRVISVGPGLEFELSVGDRVMLHPNAAWTNIEFEGRQMRVVNEEYLIALM